MKLFATRVWGFDPHNWPVVTFGLDGHRDSLLRKSSAGDAIVFVATQGEPTPEKDQGRLLGIAQFGRDPVDTLDILPEGVLRPEQYDEPPPSLFGPRARALEASHLFPQEGSHEKVFV